MAAETQSALRMTPLTDRFGVEIAGVDLRDVTATHLYPEIRAAFETQSLLLFRHQSLGDTDHLRLAALFGPIEDRASDERTKDQAFEVPRVSNVQADGTVSGEMDLHTLNLKSNQLWHTDSTFLPVPALANIITARIVPSQGGETEIASTRAAWQDMPDALREQARNAVLWHRYSHSRARLSAELAAMAMFQKWPDRAWPAMWTNPVTGEDAVYVASHAFRVDGMEQAEGSALIDALIEFCTRPSYVYSHCWQVGDLLIWDERATLHRGTPWPYEEPRVLSSLCVSVTEADGLGAMRHALG
ncbi:MAG: TauD/TfdA family dioxygenase [Pseudomonadota bacterium]